jgi:hypothetical protein
MNRRSLTPYLMAILALATIPASARIKLAALPDRAATIVRLDNPAFTLVEEERVLTLQQGINEVDFSWKGVAIDPNSIRLAVMDPKGKIVLLNVSYPPNEGALVWQLSAPQAFNARTRISYLLQNIDRLVTYKGVAEQDESRLDLESYLILRNFSGEDFDLTKVLLDYGQAFEKSVKNEETKQLLFFQKTGLPIQKTFKWNAREKPWDPKQLSENVGIPLFYTLYNTAEKGLGENVLWGGKARVFQKDGHGSTIFLGEDTADFTPVGDKMELYIGDSRDIVVTQKKMIDRMVNVRRNKSSGIVLYDNEEQIEALIENFKDKPGTIVLTEYIPGEWTMDKNSHSYELKNHETLEFRIDLKPKEKVTLTLHYLRKNLRP